MYLPIGDDQIEGGHKPWFAYGFIALNVLIFLYQLAIPETALTDFFKQYAAVPATIVAGEEWHTLFSSMFMHAGWMHLIGNMIYLWIFADNIEATVGSTAFLILYFLGGLAAHAGHIYFHPQEMVPVVGASGALAAVMGAYLVMFPRSRIKGYLLVFAVTIPALVFLPIWFAQQFMGGYAALGQAGGGGVAWWAHIGGFVFGVVAGLYFRSRYPVPSAAGGFASRRNGDDF